MSTIETAKKPRGILKQTTAAKATTAATAATAATTTATKSVAIEDNKIRVSNIVRDSKNPDLYRFRLENIHVSYANTLRRLMMTGVKTIAFNADMVKGTTSDVKIETNDTPMTNEMLAHRIGLLPIFIKDPINIKIEDYTFTLDVKGDKDTNRDITCSDFVITKSVSEGKDDSVNTADFFPPHPITKSTCLIATLPAGNTSLKLVAKASVGTGRANARWQPTSQCSYTYTLDDDEARKMEYFDRWLTNVKKYTNPDKDSEKYKAYMREFNTMEVNRVYKIRNGEPYSYEFVVETTGTLDVPRIIHEACVVGMAMMSRYVNINSEGFDEAENQMSIIPTTSKIDGYDFIMEHQDHTFGNMLQTYLSEKHMANKVVKGSDAQPITYVGYEIPHQLRDEMVLRIGCATIEEAKTAFAQGCKGCYDIFYELKNAFQATSLKDIAMNTSKGFEFSSSSSSTEPKRKTLKDVVRPVKV
jgi:DNA-directed RNA polymerase subunit L